MEMSFTRFTKIFLINHCNDGKNRLLFNNDDNDYGCMRMNVILTDVLFIYKHFIVNRINVRLLLRGFLLVYVHQFLVEDH